MLSVSDYGLGDLIHEEIQGNMRINLIWFLLRCSLSWYAFRRVWICRFLELEHSAKIKPKTPICEMRSNA